MRRLLKWLGIIVLLLLTACTALWFFLFRPPPPGTPAEPVQIVQGVVRGLDERGVTVYRGIPYAAPPVGNLRWRAPQPAGGWSGTRDAFAFSKACPQDGGPVPGMLAPEPNSEDCLYLNVWTPTERSKEPLAVMVWVHGGSNLNGSASAPPYGGANLAHKGVVVVSINYRLGALGFLAHPELTRESGQNASGNYGMMDIVAALRWVQANIRQFGGDPGNVTVFGHSAGAWNMSHMQVSPLAHGLYRRVIAMSGANFGPSGTMEGTPFLPQAEAAGVRFAAHFGAKSIAEMRSVSADRIVQAPVEAWRIAGSPHVTGIVDGYVVPIDPYGGYAARQAAPADLLIGYTSEEGVNWAKPITPAAFRRQIAATAGPFADRFLAFYPPGNSDAEALRANQRLQGERAFKWQVATWARLHQETDRGKVWLYRFSHTPGIGPFRSMGPGHGAELGHVFDFPKRGLRWGTQWPWNARREIALIDTVQDYWVNFARTGDPNGPGLPAWPALADGRKALEIGDEVQAIGWPDADEHRLMDEYMAWARASRPAR